MLKAHKRQFGNGVWSLRFGETVPESDVNLAYCWTRGLSFEENVEVRDLVSSRYDISTGASSSELRPFLMAPDESGLLHRINGSVFLDPYVKYRYFALTDVFSGDYVPENALYYYCTLSRAYAGRTDDIQGVSGEYSGPGIALFSLDGTELPRDVYRVVLTRTSYPWVYTAEIYLKSTPLVEAGVMARYTPALPVGDGYVRAPESEEILPFQSVFLPDGSKRYELVDDGSGYGYKVFVPGYGSRVKSLGAPFSWRVRGMSSLGWELASPPFYDVVARQDGDKLLSELACVQLLEREYPGVSFSGVAVELVSGDAMVSEGADGRPYARSSVPRDEAAAGETTITFKRSFIARVNPVLYKTWEDFEWTAVGTGARLGESIESGGEPHDGVGYGNGLWKRWSNASPISPISDYSLGHSGAQYIFSYGKSVTTTFETYVFVPKDVSVSFQLGNNDDITIWVNDVKQYYSGSTIYWFFGFHEWTNRCTLRLRKGWNKIRGVVHETGFWDNWTWAYTIGAFHYHLGNALGPGVPYAINDVPLPLEPYALTVTGVARCSFFPTQDAEVIIPQGAPEGVVDFKWQSVSTTNSNVTVFPADDFAVSGRFAAHMNAPSLIAVGRHAEFKGAVLPEDGIVQLASIGSLPGACGVDSSAYSQEELDHIFYTLSCDSPGVNVRYLMPGGSYATGSYGDLIGVSAVTHSQCQEQPSGQIVAWCSYAESIIGRLFAIRPLGAQPVGVQRPPVVSALHNWYIHVRDSFASREMTLPAAPHPLYSLRPELLTYVEKPVTLVYLVPEYMRQGFSPRSPIMRLTEEASVEDERTLRVSRPIYLAPGPEPYSSIGLSCGRVESVDVRNGLIRLDRPLQPAADLRVSYDAVVMSFEYRGYRQGDHFVHFDLNPGPYHTLTTDSSMAVPGHTGLIEPVSRPVRDMINRSFTVYLIPHSVLFEGMVVPGSVRDRVVYHTTMSPSELAALDPTVLELSVVTVMPNSSVGDLIVIDSRSRGGGLKEEITFEIIDRICPEARFYWDIGRWDGQAYKESGVVLIELPRSVLKAYGGRFSEDELEAAVNKYVALGVMPIVRYY